MTDTLAAEETTTETIHETGEVLPQRVDDGIEELLRPELVTDGGHSAAGLGDAHRRTDHDVEGNGLLGVLAEIDARVLLETEALVHGHISNVAGLEVDRRTTLGIDL